MKKWWSTILGVCLVASILFSCSKSNEAEANRQEANKFIHAYRTCLYAVEKCDKYIDTCSMNEVYEKCERGK